MDPRISVIVPTQDDPLIKDVVAALSAELTDGDELIVVGRDVAGRLRDCREPIFIDTGRAVSAAVARNLGMAAARGRWFFFVDADCLVQPGWATELAGCLEQGHPVVGGGVTFETDEYWPLVYNLSMFHDYLTTAPAGSRRFLPSLNLAVDRAVVQRVGLMDVRMVRGHDVDWTVRMALAGFPLYFHPAAAVVHRPQRADLATVWRYWVRSGYYNSLNRIRYRHYYGTPRLLQSPQLTLLAAPLIAAYVTGSIFARMPWLLRYAHTVPAIYLTKIAWCVGASRREQSVVQAALGSS